MVFATVEGRCQRENISFCHSGGGGVGVRERTSVLGTVEGEVSERTLVLATVEGEVSKRKN